MDRPPLQPPRSSPVSSSTTTNDAGAGSNAVTAPARAPPARRGTGVFIPPCMIKSPAASS
jgi:hypothetical protein